jgi:uncharacterized membrane protein YfcA
VVALTCAGTVAYYEYKNRRWKWLVAVAWIVGLPLAWEGARYLSRKFGVNLPDWRMVIYSLALIVMMLSRPEGLLGRRELWPRRKARSTARGFEIIHGAAGS